MNKFQNLCIKNVTASLNECSKANEYLSSTQGYALIDAKNYVKIYKEYPKCAYQIYFNKKALKFEAQQYCFDDTRNKISHADCKLKNTSFEYFYYQTDSVCIPLNDGLLFPVVWADGTFKNMAYLTKNKKSIKDALSFCEHYVEPILNNNDKQIPYYIVTVNNSGYDSNLFYLKKQNINIEDNYNDDFCYDTFLDLNKQNKTSFILLHGEPGTGKTTLLKKLINDLNGEKDVLYMDSHIFESFSSSDFLQYAMKSLKNNIVVFEDCEKLLASRDKTYSPFLNTLLNMTDGFLAEALNIHFICTFNCPLDKIDKALLRKGRLSMRYEFNKLSVEKTRKLLNDNTISEPMTLAEIYNREQNQPEQKIKKIGF